MVAQFFFPFRVIPFAHGQPDLPGFVFKLRRVVPLQWIPLLASLHIAVCIFKPLDAAPSYPLVSLLASRAPPHTPRCSPLP